MRSIIASLLLAVPVSAAEPVLSVGFAEKDVTPEVGQKKPVYLAGFATDRTALKVHDPIMAGALVLHDGTKKIALVSVDLVGLFHPSTEAVRGQLKGFDYVLISCTHNHEGPDTIGMWGPSRLETGVDPAYVKKVEEGLVQVIKDAEKKLTLATAQIGKVNAPELLNDSRLPEVKHDELVAIRFQNAKNPTADPLGILVQWNSHPETLDDKNRELSADFVGYTVNYLSKKHNCPVAYFTGTVGGLLSSLKVKIKNDKGELLKDGTFEKTEAYGIEVGKLAEKALSKSVDVSLVPFDNRTQVILVPIENNLYRIGGQLGVLKRDMYDWTGTTTPKEFTICKDVTKPVAVKSEVSYLKLGELDVAAIPGEIYPELVLDKVQTPADAGADFPDAATEPAIYPSLKNKHKMIIGLANDELGYFIPKRQWDNKPPYCYGRKESQYGEINSCGPETARVICETFQSLLKKP